MDLFAAGERDLDLQKLVAEVHLERDDRVALLVDFLREPLDLFFMEEELPRALFLMIGIATMRVARDMDVVEDGLAEIVDADPAVREVDLASTGRFDLGTRQDDAGLELVRDRIFVKGFAVVGYDLHGGLARVSPIFPQRGKRGPVHTI